MKKMLKGILLSLMLCSVCTPFPVHEHDEECGYDPETKQGCIYEMIVYTAISERDERP